MRSKGTRRRQSTEFTVYGLPNPSFKKPLAGFFVGYGIMFHLDASTFKVSLPKCDWWLVFFVSLSVVSFGGLLYIALS